MIQKLFMNHTLHEGGGEIMGDDKPTDHQKNKKPQLNQDSNPYP